MAVGSIITVGIYHPDLSEEQGVWPWRCMCSLGLQFRNTQELLVCLVVLGTRFLLFLLELIEVDLLI